MLPEKLLGAEADVLGGRLFIANGSIGLSSNAQEHTYSTPFDPRRKLRIETGTINIAQSDPDGWHTVGLETTFSNPVVILSPVSSNGRHPCVTRVRNVQATRFEMRLQEWEYLDGFHATETIHFVVVESGRYDLGSGHVLEAGVIDAGSSWVGVPFSRTHTSLPVTLSQIVSGSHDRVALVRFRNITRSAFDMQLQGEEARRIVGEEAVAYLAVSPTAGGAAGSHVFAAGVTARAVTDVFVQVDFGRSFETPPVVLAALQTSHGGDTSALRHRQLTGSRVEVRVEEEQSRDAETAHASEVVGFLALESTSHGTFFAFEESGGSVVIETEHAASTLPRNAHEWLTQELSGAVGSAVRPEPVTMMKYETEIESASPERQYPVDFTTPGTYYVWLRARADDGDSDSWHVGLDGSVQSSSDRMTIGYGFGVLVWVNRTMDSERATIHVPTPGRYAVNVWMREDGVYLDRRLLTIDSGYEPAGVGPGESLRRESTLSFARHASRTNEIAITSRDESNELSAPLELLGSYPNPFNPATTIRYVLNSPAALTLEVFDVLGRRVTLLVDEFQQEGDYDVPFDARNLAAGIYVVRLRTADRQESAPVLLLP